MPREYGLDWLRVIAFTILIFYHSGMIFVSWGFHIKNAETSRVLEDIMLFFNRWRLPLLFFISGAGVWFSLRRRSLAQFTRERTVRLLLPLLTGMFVIVPPQIWFERLTQGVNYDSYLSFWRTVFDGVSYPRGNTSWHHLWFVAYVWVYAVAMLPFFAFCRSAAGHAALERFARWLEKPWALYLAPLPSLLVSVTLGPRWPTTHNLTSDWANLTGSLVTFCWGFVIASSPALLDRIQARRREWLTGWMLTMALFYAHRWFGVGLPRLLWEANGAWLGAFAIFALTGYARHYLNRPSALLRYGTEAVFPFYIVHQTIVIAIGYYLLPLSWNLWGKLALVVAGTVAGSLLFFELARRSGPARVLFGLKLPGW